MRIKVSKIVPKGYIGITLWPFGIYVSDIKYIIDHSVINHEKIHWEQQKELLGIFFYLLYGIEYFIKLFFLRDQSAYRNLSSEREAYFNEDNFDYLETRKRYNWLKYIFKKP